MLEERQVGVRNVVQSALSVVRAYGAKVADHSMSLEQAQGAALTELGLIRYGKDGYLFVFDSRPVVLAIGNASVKSLIGQNVGERTDPNGKKYYLELAKAAAAGGGYVDYFGVAPVRWIRGVPLGYRHCVQGRAGQLSFDTRVHWRGRLHGDVRDYSQHQA
jgi:methyl-accepting chemotaxis protein